MNKSAMKTIAVLSLILVFGVSGAFAAEPTTLPGGGELQIQSAKHVVLSVNEIQAEASGLLVTGEVKRHHFSPRSRVSGRVVAEIQSADGKVLDTFETGISPRAVAKGLRASTFSLQLTKPMPKDSRLVLSFI